MRRSRVPRSNTLRNVSLEKGASDTKQCKSALKFFNEFLTESYGPGKLITNLYTSAGVMVEELVTDDLLGCFCGYMIVKIIFLLGRRLKTTLVKSKNTWKSFTLLKEIEFNEQARNCKKI